MTAYNKEIHKVNDTRNVCNENKLPNLEENYVAFIFITLLFSQVERLEIQENVWLAYFFNSVLLKKEECISYSSKWISSKQPYLETILVIWYEEIVG